MAPGGRAVGTPGAAQGCLERSAEQQAAPWLQAAGQCPSLRSPRPAHRGTRSCQPAGRRCPNTRRRRRRRATPPRCQPHRIPGWPASPQTGPGKPWGYAGDETKGLWAAGPAPSQPFRSGQPTDRQQVGMLGLPAGMGSEQHGASMGPSWRAPGLSSPQFTPVSPHPQLPGEAQSRALSLSPRTARPANHPQPCVRSSPSTSVSAGEALGARRAAIQAAQHPAAFKLTAAGAWGPPATLRPASAPRGPGSGPWARATAAGPPLGLPRPLTVSLPPPAPPYERRPGRHPGR